jgi:GTP-binding protein EngB required for normal cell division
MTDPAPTENRIVAWFRSLVRPLFQETEPAPALEEYDRQLGQVETLEITKRRLFPICLLGQAGVGKSTLVNTLIADTGIVVPSGGGTGPLTANALRVIHGERPAFKVRYHAKKQVNETRFILESQLHRLAKADVPLLPTEEDAELPVLDLDADEQKRSRSEEAIGRARLLVAGAQTGDRTLEYLADALRWVLGQAPKYEVQLLEEDLPRLRRLREAVQFGVEEETRHFDSAEDPTFNQQLRDHACGFLAPLILEMTIHWPSPLLQDSLELIDLPGIGILSDAYASLTSDYLRNRAKAVMLVTTDRGLRREDAELLRNSGFLNRLLHASNDLASDPVALIVVVVKIDDVAVENWHNERAANGKAGRTKAQHFADQADLCRTEITRRLQTFLREVWSGEDGLSEAKNDVVQSILAGLQVFPVSAPQYRLLFAADPDEEARPFLPDVQATNIPALRAAIAAIAQRCVREQARRAEDAEARFFGQVRARLEVLSAQRNEERQAETEVAAFKDLLEGFLTPLQREFDTRRGGFRNFLRKTVPTQIEVRVKNASHEARKEIQAYLRKNIRDAHWRTLQAAVRREGTFIGSRHINLPHDFALRFEEPVAEVWSRGILAEVRKDTREFADFQAGAVTRVLEWARDQGLRVSTRLLEALVEAVKQHRQQVNAVGKEAVDELRDQVREELIKQIEGPIRRKCRKFVSNGMDAGTGVRNRIVDLFEELANDVVEAASEPAVQLLVERFREVDNEILAAFGEHSDPLNEAADALVQRQEKRVAEEESKAVELSVRIESAIAAMPAGDASPTPTNP